MKKYPIFLICKYLINTRFKSQATRTCELGRWCISHHWLALGENGSTTVACLTILCCQLKLPAVNIYAQLKSMGYAIRLATVFQTTPYTAVVFNLGQNQVQFKRENWEASQRVCHFLDSFLFYEEVSYHLHQREFVVMNAIRSTLVLKFQSVRSQTKSGCLQAIHSYQWSKMWLLARKKTTTKMH